MNLVLSIILFFLPLSSFALEPISVFNQLTSLFEAESGFCVPRADVWSFQLKQIVPEQKVERIFLFPGNSIHRRLRKDFSFHVAPVLTELTGERQVYEKQDGIQTPLPVQDWIRFWAGEKCKPLVSTEEIDTISNECFYSIVPDGVFDRSDFNDFFNHKQIYQYSRKTMLSSCALVIDTDMDLTSQNSKKYKSALEKCDVLLGPMPELIPLSL